MIESIASILRSLVMFLTLALVFFIGWKSYQAWKFIEAKFARVDRYLQQADEILGQHDRKFSSLERLIDRVRPGEPAPELKTDPTPIPIEETYIQNPLRPTVILFSIEGCGPCEQWWRDKAPEWIRAGWVVKREASQTNQPTPYWKVWDGKKWLDFQRRLDFDVYKAAGGL